MILLQLFVASLLGWFQRDLHEIILYLREENRVLKAQLRRQRVRLSDDERRRLAVLGAPLGRGLLAQVATIVTPDTILRWHRQLVARKWTYPNASLDALRSSLRAEYLRSTGVSRSRRPAR